MSLDFKPLRREKENFLVNSLTPTYIPAGVVSANDMACLAAWVEVVGCSAGISVLTPGLISFEYSPDDGITWVAIPFQKGGVITGNGADSNVQVTADSGIFPPLIRIKLTAPAGEYFTVKHIRRNYVTPGLVAPLRSPSGSAPIVGFGDPSVAQRVAAELGALVELPVPAAVGYKEITSSPFTKSVANDGRALDVNVINTVSTPDFTQLSDGTNTITPFENYLVNTQFTNNLASWKLPVSASLVGWDYTNNLRKELLCSTTGVLESVINNFPTSFNNTFTYNSVATIPVYDNALPANNVGLPSVQLAGEGLAPVAMGSGSDSVLTQRVTLSTRHEDVTTPLSNRISDGTNFVGLQDNVLVGAQYIAPAAQRFPVTSVSLGFDTTNNVHKEVALDGTGKTLLAARHEALATPLAAQLSDTSVNSITFTNLLVGAQYTSPGGYRMPTTSAMIAWNGTAHKEIKSNATDVLQVEVVNTSTTNAVQRSKANAPLYRDYTTSPTTAAAWTQLIASTTAQATKIHVFDSSGTGWYLAFGGAGSEVAQIIIPPGGDTVELLIPINTRISSQAVDATALNVGSLQMSLLS